MLLFCVYFDLVTDQIYRTVQLMQNKGMKEMFLINFVNFALLLPIFLNYTLKWYYLYKLELPINHYFLHDHT